MRSSTLVRTLAVPAVLALALTGCGSSDKSSSSPSSTPSAPSLALSAVEAKSALITDKEIGDKFKEDTSPDEDSDGPGCLNDIDKSTGDAPVDEKRNYVAIEEPGFPFVGNEIASYDSVEAADASVQAVRNGLKTCTSVDAKTSDGTAWKLDIKTDDTKSFTGGDDQINITEVGTLTGTDGTAVDVYVTMSAVRVKNTVSILTVVDQGSSPTPNISDLLDMVAKRLVAVANDKDPDAAA